MPNRFLLEAFQDAQDKLEKELDCYKRTLEGCQSTVGVLTNDLDSLKEKMACATHEDESVGRKHRALLAHIAGCKEPPQILVRTATDLQENLVRTSRIRQEAEDAVQQKELVLKEAKTLMAVKTEERETLLREQREVLEQRRVVNKTA